MKKLIFWTALALGICCAGLWYLPRHAMQANSWGLHFPKEGGFPEPPADAGRLAEYGGFYQGSRDEKVLYLTFDSGYENGSTEKILDILQKKKIPAAFFLTGNYIQRNPELVKRMAREGHQVCNHTMHHRDMTAQSKSQFCRELEDLEQLYLKTTGRRLDAFYRPPMGKYTLENLKTARQMGYQTVFWSLAYQDWDNKAQPSRETALKKLLPRVHNGAVILLHSTSGTNAAILEELIETLQAQNYTFSPLQAGNARG